VSQSITYSGSSSKPHDTGVAVAVIITKKGKILLMKRKGSTGEGTWPIPGGAIEFNEDTEDAAKRETLEETGLIINNLKFLGYTNDIHHEASLHYVTLRFFITEFQGKESILEPDKCSAIKWFDINSLPKPMFKPTLDIINKSDVIKLIKET
jgi:8-oxo-dGTP diphosphatase